MSNRTRAVCALACCINMPYITLCPRRAVRTPKYRDGMRVMCASVVRRYECIIHNPDSTSQPGPRDATSGLSITAARPLCLRNAIHPQTTPPSNVVARPGRAMHSVPHTLCFYLSIAQAPHTHTQTPVHTNKRAHVNVLQNINNVWPGKKLRENFAVCGFLDNLPAQQTSHGMHAHTHTCTRTTPHSFGSPIQGMGEYLRVCVHVYVFLRAREKCVRACVRLR